MDEASCETIFELFQHYGENWWRHDQILRRRRSIPLGGESFEIERGRRERTKFYKSWLAERSNRSRGGTVERLRRDADRTTLVAAASRPFAPRQLDARARARARSRKWKHVKVGKLRSGPLWIFRLVHNEELTLRGESAEGRAKFSEEPSGRPRTLRMCWSISPGANTERA